MAILHAIETGSFLSDRQLMHLKAGSEYKRSDCIWNMLELRLCKRHYIIPGIYTVGLEFS